MAIKRIEIKDFLMFTGDFAVDFCPGVNVIIGGNATGKTTLIKILRASYDKSIRVVSEMPPEDLEIDFDKKWLNFHSVGLSKYFPYTGYDFKDLLLQTINEGITVCIADVLNKRNKGRKLDECQYMVKTIGNKQVTDIVYIPVNDMLSHSEGLLALYNLRKLPFDKTHIDILSMASMPETRDVTSNAKKVLNILEKTIGGTVIVENDVFFILHKDGKKIPFTLTASGYKKLGLLWKLIRNGLLEPGSVLFWDEPENSLNPEYVPVLVDILLELSRNGVQIFIATHSELLASYFAVNRNEMEEVLFVSLFKEGDIINTNSSDRFDWLIPNNLTDEPVKLYEKQIERGLGK